MNTVGTFGIASASYYWSRVAAAVGRLVQYLSAHFDVLAYARRRRLFVGVRRPRVSRWIASVFRVVRSGWRALFMAQDVWR